VKRLPMCQISLRDRLDLQDWKATFLGKDPGSTAIKHRLVVVATHAKFSAPIKNIPPEKVIGVLCIGRLTLFCCRL
jgi:hypothetical protein